MSMQKYIVGGTTSLEVLSCRIEPFGLRVRVHRLGFGEKRGFECLTKMMIHLQVSLPQEK
jgi:hypothetical protein